MQGKKMFKVLSPVEKKDKAGNVTGTYWNKCGIGFTNKDDSINLHLDVIPLSGKLQLRDFDEEDKREPRRLPANGATPTAAGDNMPF